MENVSLSPEAVAAMDMNERLSTPEVAFALTVMKQAATDVGLTLAPLYAELGTKRERKAARRLIHNAMSSVLAHVWNEIIPPSEDDV